MFFFFLRSLLLLYRYCYRYTEDTSIIAVIDNVIDGRRNRKDIVHYSNVYAGDARVV